MQILVLHLCWFPLSYVQMALSTKLALLLIHILSVSGNGYGSLQENHARDDELSKEDKTPFDFSFKSGFAIGYAFSSVSVSYFLMFYFVHRHNKRKRSKQVRMRTPMMASLMARRQEKKIASRKISKLEKSMPRFSFATLNLATGSFDRNNVIGVGKMGTVYKAAHPHLRFTAVKRLYDSQHLEDQFMSELMILGKLRHKNIVPLLGSCIESKERFLVYKYMPNGSLYHLLHPVKGEARILDWHFRIEIAVGIARGLAWLHDYNTFQVVHLNLSSNCILLDKYFEPKISKFGEAMFLSSNVRGFIANSKKGELDLSKKDVYQFGILLLELITGEDPVNNSELYHTLEETFARNQSLWTGFSGLYCAVDKTIFGQGIDHEVLYLLTVARNCIQPIPDQRPTMVEVYKILMAVRKTNGGPNTDGETGGQTDIVTSTDSSDDSLGPDEIIEVK